MHSIGKYGIYLYYL